MTMSAAQYHWDTSYRRHRMEAHGLDWNNRPAVYKSYPAVAPVRLPEGGGPAERGFFHLLEDRGPEEGVSREVDLEILSLLLRLSCTVTARARHRGGEFSFRSAASAGALYPCEVYAAAQGVEGLADGLYHFGVEDHALYLLRPKDLPGPGAPCKRPLGLTFFLSAIFFRSAWKYRERAYRYHLLDTGHLTENLVLALESLGLPCRLSYDFDDQEVNQLLGLDERKEVCLAVAHVLSGEVSAVEPGWDAEPLPRELQKASQVAPAEVDFPAIRKIHAAGVGRLSPPGPAPEMLRELGVVPETWVENRRPAAPPEIAKYPRVLFLRRSRRNFVRSALPKDCLEPLLEALAPLRTGGMPGGREHPESVCCGFLAGLVEGLDPGFYLLDRARKVRGEVRRGPQTEMMAGVCLEQGWLSAAAVHFLFMADIAVLDRSWGPRGYRYALLNAGRLGQRLYLAATALGLGCCGIGAFYDQEAADLLGLQGEARLLYLVAVGPVKEVAQ